MARSPLTERFLRIVTLRDEVKTWPQDEQDFFLDMLLPEPEPAKKPQKKSSKKAAGKGGSKSARAASLARHLQNAAGITPPSPNQCVAELPNGAGICGNDEDDSLHTDSSYGNYHEFQPGKSNAQSAGARSSANGGATSSGVNSETGTGAVSSAVQGVK